MEKIDGLDIEDPLSLGYDDLSSFFSGKPVKRIVLNESNSYSPDLLSYNHYGTYEFWQLICCLNRIKDPFKELKPGTVIYIPRHSDVLDYLSRKSKRDSEVRIVDLG